MINRHIIEISKKNTNCAEKQNHESIKLDFCGVYPANYERPAIVNINIDITHYYEATSRQMFGSVDLTKEQVIELRDELNTMIDSDKWEDQLQRKEAV